MLLHADASSEFASPVLLPDVPFFPQRDYQCGPAALATVLRFSHVAVTPDELVPLVYLPARQGSLQTEMLAAARRHGRLAYVLPPSLASVLKEVQRGQPVLVMQNLGVSWYPRWHYAVIVGYDFAGKELLLNSGTIERYRMPITLFERTWQRADHWSMVVLTPGDIAADATEHDYLAALVALAATPQVDGSGPPAIATGYRAGIERWPASSSLAMGLGNVLYNEGQIRAAADQFSAILDRAPDYAPAHNNLAQVLMELGNGAAALEHARRAVTLGGDHRETYSTTLNQLQALPAAHNTDGAPLPE